MYIYIYTVYTYIYIYGTVPPFLGPETVLWFIIGFTFILNTVYEDVVFTQSPDLTARHTRRCLSREVFELVVARGGSSDEFRRSTNPSE